MKPNVRAIATTAACAAEAFTIGFGIGVVAELARYGVERLHGALVLERELDAAMASIEHELVAAAYAELEDRAIVAELDAEKWTQTAVEWRDQAYGWHREAKGLTDTVRELTAELVRVRALVIEPVAHTEAGALSQRSLGVAFRAPEDEPVTADH